MSGFTGGRRRRGPLNCAGSFDQPVRCGARACNQIFLGLRAPVHACSRLNNCRRPHFAHSPRENFPALASSSPTSSLVLFSVSILFVAPMHMVQAWAIFWQLQLHME